MSELAGRREEALERSRPSQGREIPKRLAYGAGGAMLILTGLRQRGVARAAMAVAGGDLLYHGIRGEGHLHNAAIFLARTRTNGLPYGRGVKINESIDVDQPARDLYRFWRDFDNLPTFMDLVESVEVEDEFNSRWTLKLPTGGTISWHAEVIADRQDELIGWRSIPGSVVDHAGSVRFISAKKKEGPTTVSVKLQYNPVAGRAGAKAARILGADPAKQVREDLQRFKRLAESVNLEKVGRVLHRHSA